MRSSKNWLFFHFLLVCIFLSFSGYAQNCNSDLSVEKNRNVKSAGENGAVYLLTLTNNTSKTNTYHLASVFSDLSCANKNRQTRSANVTLNVAFEGNSSVITNNQITVGSGQSKKFKVRVTVPGGTPYRTWSCIQIQARAEHCNNAISETLLRVFVPDPSEG